MPCQYSWMDVVLYSSMDKDKLQAELTKKIGITLSLHWMHINDGSPWQKGRNTSNDPHAAHQMFICSQPLGWNQNEEFVWIKEKTVSITHPIVVYTIYHEIDGHELSGKLTRRMGKTTFSSVQRRYRHEMPWIWQDTSRSHHGHQRKRFRTTLLCIHRLQMERTRGQLLLSSRQIDQG